MNINKYFLLKNENIALKKYKSFEHKTIENQHIFYSNIKKYINKKHGNIKQFTASNLYNKSITNYKDF